MGTATASSDDILIEIRRRYGNEGLSCFGCRTECRTEEDSPSSTTSPPAHEPTGTVHGDFQRSPLGDELTRHLRWCSAKTNNMKLQINLGLGTVRALAIPRNWSVRTLSLLPAKVMSVSSGEFVGKNVHVGVAVDCNRKGLWMILRTAPSFDTMVNTPSKSLLSILEEEAVSVNSIESNKHTSRVLQFVIGVKQHGVCL